MFRLSFLLTVALGAAAVSSPRLADAGQPHGRNAIGVPGKASAKARLVEVSVGDEMRFTPAAIEVRRGETIRFVVRNRGRLKHEMVLGRIADLQAHAALMQKFPNMQHDEPNMVSIEPGASAEFRWQFSRAGVVDFACLVPGHYEAGMRGQVTVAR